MSRSLSHAQRNCSRTSMIAPPTIRPLSTALSPASACPEDTGRLGRAQGHHGSKSSKFDTSYLGLRLTEAAPRAGYGDQWSGLRGISLPMRTLLALISAAVLASPAAAADRAQLDANAKALGFKAHGRIAKDALAGARLVKGGSGAVGETRLGGRPDLPPEMRRPSCKGRRLSFLAQVRLAKVASGALPRAGVLTVFGDAKENGDGFVPIEDTYGRVGNETRVIVRELNGALERRALPRGVERLENVPVRLKPTLTVPDIYIAESRYGFKDDRKLQERWFELSAEAALGRLHHLGEDEYDGVGYQLLGWPSPVQDSPLYGCTGKPTKRTYRLLFQLDLGIGDGGVLYLTGTPADMRAGRFNR